VTSASIVNVAVAALQFYSFLILIYVLLSWLQSVPLAVELRRVLGTICEPYIGLFRKIVPRVGAGGVGLDLSPLVAILVLQIVIRLVRGLL
jgi:uncharacterized protein YggT (Ycf19 family)